MNLKQVEIILKKGKFKIIKEYIQKKKEILKYKKRIKENNKTFKIFFFIYRIMCVQRRCVSVNKEKN